MTYTRVRDRNAPLPYTRLAGLEKEEVAAGNTLELYRNLYTAAILYYTLRIICIKVFPVCTGTQCAMRCHTLVSAYERMARPSRARGPCPFSSNGTSCPASQFAYYRLPIGARSTVNMRTVVRLLLTLANSLCVLHTPDRSARSPGKVRSGNVLHVRIPSPSYTRRARVLSYSQYSSASAQGHGRVRGLVFDTRIQVPCEPYCISRRCSAN